METPSILPGQIYQNGPQEGRSSTCGGQSYGAEEGEPRGAQDTVLDDIFGLAQGNIVPEKKNTPNQDPLSLPPGPGRSEETQQSYQVDQRLFTPSELRLAEAAFAAATVQQRPPTRSSARGSCSPSSLGSPQPRAQVTALGQETPWAAAAQTQTSLPQIELPSSTRRNHGPRAAFPEQSRIGQLPPKTTVGQHLGEQNPDGNHAPPGSNMSTASSIKVLEKGPAAAERNKSTSTTSTWALSASAQTSSTAAQLHHWRHALGSIGSSSEPSNPNPEPAASVMAHEQNSPFSLNSGVRPIHKTSIGYINRRSPSPGFPDTVPLPLAQGGPGPPPTETQGHTIGDQLPASTQRNLELQFSLFGDYDNWDPR